MAPKIFLTGVTGYIGGDAFYAVYEAYPDYEFTVLVRTEEKGKPVSAKYPNVRLVYGDLNSSDLLEKEAAAADIVIHTAESSDDVPSAKSIAKGLAAGHTAEKPGFWLHVCGTGILQWYDQKHKRFGQPPIPEEKYHDIKDIDRILNLPDEADHRDVDKIVIAANSPAVRIAIIGPPTIYGKGRGPVNTRSQQVPGLAKFTLEKGFAPIIGTGETEWDNVHIHDLSAFFVDLVAATRDPKRSADPEIFGPHAYYFLESAVHRWSDVARWIAEEAWRQGFLPAALTKPATVKEADEAGDGVSSNSSWGFNSKSVAERARKYFGWTPKGTSLKDEIPGIVAVEAKLLGLTPHEKIQK